ncbi:MAG: ferritin-like domain-containing protein, partial [Chloroflexota bacterium]|nr:ferritin-like domain-containing protein [Chloroflexota bacterium]
GVEARHASYLNGLNEVSPFPDAVDAPLTPDEVLAIAGPFIVS